MSFADRDSMNYHDDVGYDNSDQPTCQECGKVVVWSRVEEEFEHIIAQANSHGLDSLTEQEQVVMEGAICSYDCYEAMQVAEQEYWQRRS